MQFMFSADPMASNQIDEYFKPQAANLTAFGNPAIFSVEEDKASSVRSGETIIYRGWMLNSSEYCRMGVLMEQKGSKLLTSLKQYLNTHHIPNWYPILREYTPETFFIDNKWLSDGCDIVAELKKLGWTKFFLKDFVKSLKTAGGSVVNTPEDAPRVVKLMEQYRGTIEGGLCVRKFEELRDEQRYFIVNKHVWSPALREIDRPILETVAERIDSPFFSVDVAHNVNDHPRVVEIGDGQVSDLVGWDPEIFATIFKDL
ncbi:MAG TPA: ATP-grasp domain-containing protein [Terracidiphilus sp.]